MLNAPGLASTPVTTTSTLTHLSFDTTSSVKPSSAPSLKPLCLDLLQSSDSLQTPCAYSGEGRRPRNNGHQKDTGSARTAGTLFSRNVLHTQLNARYGAEMQLVLVKWVYLLMYFVLFLFNG